WVTSGPATGECVCTPGSSTYSIPCEEGFTGTASETETITCNPGRTYTYTQDRSSCTCRNIDDNMWTEACPGDQVGSRTFYKNHVCPTDGSPPYWTEIMEDTDKNTCKCNVFPPDVRTVSCPAFHTGTKTETWEYG